MDSQPFFLRLPREIRDMIYKFYVSEEDRYLFNLQSSKFAIRSTLSYIDLSLMYTCAQVANKMKGIALSQNVVVFSTFYSKAYRSFAGEHNFTIRHIDYAKTVFIERRAPILSNILEGEYPQLSPLLEYLKQQKLGERWPAKRLPGALSPRWAIPPLVYLDFIDRYVELGELAGSAFDETWKNDAAIPECHARGLIMYCQENPLLRINRRIDLWRNALIATTFLLGEIMNPFFVPQRLHWEKLPASWISKVLGTWIHEAVALPSLGMPKGCFSLVFNGDPAPKEASEIFTDILQRDFAWQSAYENVSQRSLHPTTWLNVRSHICYIYEGFPEEMKRIANNNSIVRCNFHVGLPQDVKEIMNRNKYFSYEEWANSWGESRRDRYLDAPSCLPSWHEMLKEHHVFRLNWRMFTFLVIWACCFSFSILYFVRCIATRSGMLGS
ncbi:hypothetical protein BS50DRAFT_654031 [Corynespora cassiicola Philippines]|uniref:Uncharacterized protein n=1 Tax=Corynespora cassiicola Philippines TaxID=1448308 RepID=A0A2T2P7I7_CORCC|nr:hypothetical protein BS50DRAFT_654031 [Corynespora cassiicola Philippines]